MFRSFRRMTTLAVALVAAVSASALTAGGAAAAPAVPRVVASVPPIHSLVARVMAGVGAPTLLIPATASPHSFSLKPSDAHALSSADIVVWVGPALETALAEPLANLSGDARIVTLAEADDVALLAIREGGVWGMHAHGDEHADDHDRARADRHEHAAAAPRGETAESGIDPHIWLSTDNARAIVAAIAAALIAQDPAHAATYAANRDATRRALAELTGELRARLDPVHDRPFVVLHDGYQYFERQFGLAAVGAITVAPDIHAGARRLVELRREVRARNARCVFSEPQFSAAQVRTVAEGTGARVGVLDPIGVGLAPGPDLYAQLMTGLAAGFNACLAADG